MKKKLNNRKNVKPITTVLCLVLFFSCTQETVKTNDNIVKVGDQTLTWAELNENLPPFTSAEDSVLIAEHFIRQWIDDHLLYNAALKNISNKKTIEQWVENYRRSLIIYQYQEQLVNEKLAKDINKNELLEYYKENNDKFKLDNPLIKGIFLRAPIKAPQIEQARAWCKNFSAASVGDIEKYSVQNAAGFDYFVDKWIDFNELTNEFPFNYKEGWEIIKRQAFFEQKDETHYYFLNIVNYLLPGDSAPFEYVAPTIKEMLINQKKREFLRKTEEDLYNKALNSGQITVYYE